jgi:hypothetical protein
MEIRCYRTSRDQEVAEATSGNKSLPTLNIWSPNIKQLDFLRMIGEQCELKYHLSIAEALRNDRKGNHAP